MSAYKPIFERFSCKYRVNPETECWDWTGSRDVGGYGRIKRERTQERRFRTMPAHVFSYEHFIGPVPAGALVLHECDNRRCVNPKHLFLGDHASNMKDMAIKGRRRALSSEHAKEAFELWTSGEFFGPELAIKYGVHYQTMWKILQRARTGDYGPDVASLNRGTTIVRVLLTDAERSEIVRLLRENLPIIEIARRTGRSRKTVRNVRAAMN